MTIEVGTYNFLRIYDMKIVQQLLGNKKQCLLIIRLDQRWKGQHRLLILVQ